MRMVIRSCSEPGVLLVPQSAGGGGGGSLPPLTGATEVFNFSNFASTSALTMNGPVTVVSDALQICASGSGHNGGYPFYTAGQTVGPFTTIFEFQITPAASGANPTLLGFTFCIQAATQGLNGTGLTPGPTAAGAGDSNCSGYSLLIGASQPAYQPTMGVKFDLSGEDVEDQEGIGNAPSGGFPNSTGLYTGGGPGAQGLFPCNDLQPFGINFYSGDVFQAKIVYDGTILALTITDTTTGASSRHQWPLNLSDVIGQSTAWVGFTSGGIDNTNSAIQILNWEYWSGYNTRLATPTFSLAPGEYSSTQTCSLSAQSGTTIYYTTSGNDPTPADTEYTGPITISANTILKAIAVAPGYVAPGYTDSYIAVAQYQIGTSNVINFPSGFAANDGMVLFGSAFLSSDDIYLTDTRNYDSSDSWETGAAWFGDVVNVESSWTADFTIQATDVSGGANGTGMCFVIQNNIAATNTTTQWSPGGLGSLGCTGAGFGYGPPETAWEPSGVLSSLAVFFDMGNNQVGLVTEGNCPTGGSAPGSINLTGGNPITVSLTYSGTTLAISMEDTVTHDTYSVNLSTSLSIPTLVGANTAYVGFSGAAGYGWCNQIVSNFTM